MVILLTLVHVVVCFFLIIVVLLQSGQAADLAGAFGGMGSQTAFGPRGSATILSKATTTAAVIFMITSMTLAIIATRRQGATSTVLETPGAQTQQTTPAPAKTAPISQQSPTKGKPSVTYTDTATGKSKTVPLDVPTRQGSQQSPSAPPAKP